MLSRNQEGYSSFITKSGLGEKKQLKPLNFVVFTCIQPPTVVRTGFENYIHHLFFEEILFLLIWFSLSLKDLEVHLNNWFLEFKN